MKFLETANDESKMYVINSLDTFADISKNDIKNIIRSMSNEYRTTVLSNKELLTRFKFNDYDLSGLLLEIEDDEIKYKVAKENDLSQNDLMEVIKSFSDENKKRIVLEDKEGFSDRYIANIISSMAPETVIDFINNQQEFLAQKNIKPFEITKLISEEKQINLAELIDELNLQEGEKRRIFATFSNEAKKEIKRKMILQKANHQPSTIDEKYSELIEMESLYGRVTPELEGDLSRYTDLGELIKINPLETIKSDENRQQLLKLCEICPDIEITDNLLIGRSTGEEYIKGEEWINTVLEGIQQEWTDVQKLAYIDTMIGKRVSYTPDFGTEVENRGDARALWRIITSGYGVCNGIAQIEKYLLERIGIEAEIISGKHHVFVKVKNIEIPTENGIVRGDTLVDPTWNLTASRYGSMPQHFCKSYGELRKVDIDEKDKDHECHKNDDLEQSDTIDMDIDTLRQVYKSIGIADKDGKFPIGELIQQARQIDETSTDIQSNIASKFAILKKWCPEFTTCQNSTIDVIRGVLFEKNEHFDFKRCVASRVFDRKDAKKQAVLYIYMELEGIGKQFFYADKENAEFIPLSQEEFEAKFECYESDMQKLPGGKRPWESKEQIQENIVNSSGQVAQEGR